MDVQENAFACGEGMWLAGWGREQGWQGSRDAGVWGSAAWKRARLDRGCLWEESWCVGVLAREDGGPGSVLKQKGLIFSFEMAFLISWNTK